MLVPKITSALVGIATAVWLSFLVNESSDAGNLRNSSIEQKIKMWEREFPPLVEICKAKKSGKLESGNTLKLEILDKSGKLITDQEFLDVVRSDCHYILEFHEMKETLEQALEVSDKLLKKTYEMRESQIANNKKEKSEL
jgi:hypothetical protein